jgi:hypothetical protein
MEMDVRRMAVGRLAVVRLGEIPVCVRIQAGAIIG